MHETVLTVWSNSSTFLLPEIFCSKHKIRDWPRASEGGDKTPLHFENWHFSIGFSAKEVCFLFRKGQLARSRKNPSDAAGHKCVTTMADEPNLCVYILQAKEQTTDVLIQNFNVDSAKSWIFSKHLRMFIKNWIPSFSQEPRPNPANPPYPPSCSFTAQDLRNSWTFFTTIHPTLRPWTRAKLASCWPCYQLARGV